MGIFDFAKGKASAQTAEVITFPAALGAVSKGMFVDMEQIPDEVFSAGVLGVCCGVDPDEGEVYAPISGKIIQVADTLHAIGIEAAGIELLIHVGVDTVEMNGEGFQPMVKLGQNVKKGDLLLTMDLDKIHSAGYPATVIMAVTNSGDFSDVESVAAGHVDVGDDVLRVCKQ